jgi:hypothetical protein
MGDLKIKSKLQQTAGMVRVAAHLVSEPITGSYTPTRGDGVPKSADNLSKEWLTAVLCREHSGAEVTGFELDRKSKGSTARRAVAVSYNETGSKAENPTHLFTKSTPNFQTRLINSMSGAFIGESTFYEKIRPSINVESPLGYHVAVDPLDVSARRCRDHSQRKVRGCDHPEGDRTDSPLADGAARFATCRVLGQSSPPRDLGILRTTYKWLSDATEFINFEKRSIGSGVESDQRVPQGTTPAAVRPLGGLHGLAQNQRTRPDDDSAPGCTRWQLVRHRRRPGGALRLAVHGDWGYAKDVAYAITAALAEDDRRAWERDLINHYVEGLHSHGVTSVAFDGAWLAYRQQTFHPLFFALVTIGRSAFQPNMQADHVCLDAIGRMGRAMVDLDSLGALDER